jgi:hypothetical protein
MLNFYGNCFIVRGIRRKNGRMTGVKGEGKE